jgi:hypothetical protein
MGFEEILGIALNRMRAQTLTHEDPIAVLQAIYEGKESPHGDIRQWAKDFLVKSEGDDDAGHWSPSSTSSEPGPPNLWKLKTEMCFRERFAELCERCGALHIDVLKAEETLVREGRWLGGRVPSPKRGGGMKLLGAAGVGVAGMGYGLPPVSVIPPPMGISLGVGVGIPGPHPHAAIGRGALGLGMGMGIGAAGIGMAPMGGPGWREEAAVADEYARFMERVDYANAPRNAAAAARLGLGGGLDYY